MMKVSDPIPKTILKWAIPKTIAYGTIKTELKEAHQTRGPPIPRPLLGASGARTWTSHRPLEKEGMGSDAWPHESMQ